MFEVAIRTEVQRFQACVGNQLQQPFPAQADRVPRQAKSTARLQLPSPNWKCLADQTGCRTVPLPAFPTYVCLAAMDDAVRRVCQHGIEPALPEECRRLTSVARQDRERKAPIPADRDYLGLQRLPMILPSRRTGLSSRECFSRLRRQ